MSENNVFADIQLKHNMDTFNPAALLHDCHLCAMPSHIADELRLQKVRRKLEAKKQ